MQLCAVADDDDDDADEDPALYKKLLDNQIVLSLTGKGADAFDFFRSSSATNPLPSNINPASLYQWEQQVNSLSSELSQLTNKDALLAVYASLLMKVAPSQLDPLQTATFQLLSNAIMDTLIKLRPPMTPVTDLIDEVTAIHLDFVEKFQQMIDDGGDEGYSQSSAQEYLCYQFAGLVRRTYSRISRGLGSEFDMAASTQELRINSWVSPVYARLQRRFVRFLAANAEEQEVEINAASFDKLLGKLKLEVTPRYSLSGVRIDRSQSPSGDGGGGSGSIIEASSNDPSFYYPSWETASFISKIIRNVVATIDIIPALESKVTGSFQSDLSDRIKPLAKPLEKLASAYCNVGPSTAIGIGGTSSGATQLSVLGGKELGQVEEMLNLAHDAVAAVYATWQIRHNIIGVAVPDPTAPKTSDGGAGVRMEKDFLRAVVLRSPESVRDSIPKAMRAEVGFTVEDAAERLKPTPGLEAAAWMAHAVRTTASDEFRSLVTYNSDQDQWPENRDAVFIVVLAAVLTDALTAPGELDILALYENIIALAALEETLGVREPRSACTKGYQAALRNAALQLAKQQGSGVGPSGVSDRVKEIERILGMALRLPEGAGKRARVDAFKDSIDVILAAASAAAGAGASASSGLREVEAVYGFIAQMLFISPDQAKAYVQPLGQARFDKAVGSILMSADMAVSIPVDMQAEMGTMFRTQVRELAEDVMMTTEQGEQRTVYLAAAVFESLLETALEESRRLNNDRAEVLVRRAYSLSKHPLMLLIAPGDADNKMVDVGVKMVVSRLGTSPVMELMRMLEFVRARNMGDPSASGVNNSGWGGSVTLPVSTDPQLLAFITTIQTAFMKEYAAGSMKRGYSTK